MFIQPALRAYLRGHGAPTHAGAARRARSRRRVQPTGVAVCRVSSAVCRVVVDRSRACLSVSVECCRVCLTVEIISTTSLKFDLHCSPWSGVTISHGSRADPDGLAVGSDGSSLALAAAICGNCGLMSQRLLIPNQPD